MTVRQLSIKILHFYKFTFHEAFFKSNSVRYIYYIIHTYSHLYKIYCKYI